VKTPLTLITEEFIPIIRMLLAKKLRERGMSQSKIASILGVTQPAVKQYLDESEEKGVDRLKEMGLSEEEINSLLEDLADITDIKSSMYYITDFSLRLLSEFKFCKYHREKDKSIPIDCDICKFLYHSGEEERLELALSMLQNPLVTPLIPEVLSNIAFAKQNAKGEKDVIAVAGRITKVMGIPSPASKPMWGASKHLSKILLNVMKRNNEVRSVMNIKFDERVKRAIQDLNFKVAYAGPHDYASDEDIVNDVIAVYNPDLDCVVHLGGKSVEPNTYVFGKDPVEVVKKVLDIAKKYRDMTEN
jgi:predicted fused transcriptional regulator/phosphomethylpyrimidine kinase/predicted transcriptional regulator